MTRRGPTLVGLVSVDAPLRERVARALEGTGAALAATDTPSGGDVMLVDARCPGASPAWVATAKAGGADRPVVWLTTGPCDAASRAALGAGADDVWDVSVEEPILRVRLRRLSQAARQRPDPVPGNGDLPEAAQVRFAAYAQQLEASQENLRALYDEVEAQARELQALLHVQESLIACQDPDQIADLVREALETWFPRSRVEVRPDAQPSSREVVESRIGRWTRARLPLPGPAGTLGWLSITAPDAHGHPPRHLDLLEALAGQAGQALHRSRMYQALSQGKMEWEHTFDAIPDTIAILDPSLTVLRTNRALARVAGLHPREVVGRRCHEVLYRRTEPCEGCPLPGVFATGEQVEQEQELRRGDRVFAFRAYPLKTPDGEVYAAVSYARDLTRERALAQTLEQHEKLVTLGQIAAGIAHEINNPLTAVSSYSQLMLLRLKDPKNIESARRIQDGIDRIHRLVRNLMSFVRPDREDFYPLDLNEMIADALSFSRYEITRGETRLVEDLASQLPKVLGSKEQLEHVFVNLLTNARDAVAGRGTIRVETRSENGSVYLRVTDDGMGIEPERLEKVFEPFYTTKPAGQGTGLGLFIAAGITQKHGGELGVDSVPGRGTSVTLYLPAFSD